MRLITTFFLFTILCGCIPNSDSTDELSGDYFYRDEGTHYKDIISHLPNRASIYSEIIEYDYNSDFIVALQTPVYEEYKCMLGFELRDNLKKYPTNSYEDIIESEKLADSILTHDAFYASIFKHEFNYWIIAHKSGKIYGPLQREEYLKWRKELDIPDRVRIKVE